MSSQMSLQQTIGRREWILRHVPARISHREYNLSITRQRALRLTLGSSSTILFHPLALFVLRFLCF
jgi:hypothetical protein